MPVLLDRAGDALTPNGYLVVSTERALINAIGRDALMVKGAKLCAWAERICRARERECREIQSPIEALRGCCAALTPEDAGDIFEKLASAYETLKQPITIRELLIALYPDGPWTRQPSRRHAAEWLLWIASNNPKSSTRPLLAQIGEDWEHFSFGQESALYRIHDAEGARDVLRRWLRIRGKALEQDYGCFPFDVVDDKWINEARVAWGKRLAAHGPGFFREISNIGLPGALVEAGANLVYEYYSINKHLIIDEDINLLSGFLDENQINRLRHFRPPSVPSDPPSAFEEMQQWFTQGVSTLPLLASRIRR